MTLPARAALLCLFAAGAAAPVAACGADPATDDRGGAEATPSAPDASAGPEGDAAPRADAATDAPPASDGGRDAAPSDGSVDPPSDAAADASPLDAAPDAPVVITDPFDPRSCDGPALSSADALVMLGGRAHVKLADATLMRRSRSCPGGVLANCGPWTAPVAHTQALLTYSGGVVTDYKTFSFPTHLVLWSQGGAAKMSVRHTSDYRHDANASARGVVFGFGPVPMVNTYPIIYVWDFAPAPNRYDDLQGKLGQQAELWASAGCARLLVTSGLTQEIAALYTY